MFAKCIAINYTFHASCRGASQRAQEIAAISPDMELFFFGKHGFAIQKTRPRAACIGGFPHDPQTNPARSCS